MSDPREVKINYCALTLAILSQCSLETAFEKIESYSPTNRAVISEADIRDMRKFRDEGLFYREIASYYGISKDAVYSRLNPRKPGVCDKEGIENCQTTKTKVAG